MKKIILLVLSVLLCACQSGNKTDYNISTIDDAVTIYYEYKNFNTDVVKSLAPIEYWDLLKEHYEIDIDNDEDFETYFQTYIDNQKVAAGGIYGGYDNQDYPAYFLISKTAEPIEGENLEYLMYVLNQYYGIDYNDIGEAYTVSMSHEIVGDIMNTKEHILITFVKINGSFYPLTDGYMFIVSPYQAG